MNEIKGMGVEMLFPVRAFREFRGASHFIIDVIRLPADGITLWVTLRVIYRVRSLGLGSSFPQPLTPLAPLAPLCGIILAVSPPYGLLIPP